MNRWDPLFIAFHIYKREKAEMYRKHIHSSRIRARASLLFIGKDGLPCLLVVAMKTG